MNITTPNTIEDHIFTILQKGTLHIVELIEIIKKERIGTTKQGVYLVVKKLKKQEVVVIHNKNISLSSVWLSAMEEFITKAQYNTKRIISSGNSFLNLKEGEKLQYYFRNPILTDVFWSHTFLTLVELSLPQSPVLIYNPHEWFLLARTKNESDLFEKISKREQKLNMLVGHNTVLDKTVRKYFIGTNEYEILPRPLFEKENYYINVIADFVIEVWIDKKISLEINNFYDNTQIFGDAEKEKLEKILMQKGKNRFSITHNKRKADGLRKVFKRYF
ncbi:MAG: hypothetical protein WC827_02605 [Candidatus Paceibacterota bacterium]|jgi:hypothetical protein